MNLKRLFLKKCACPPKKKITALGPT